MCYQCNIAGKLNRFVRCDLALLLYIQLLSLLSFALLFRYLPREEIHVHAYGTGVVKHQGAVESIPYQVLVVYERFYCSGSLIGSRTVVTTASCFRKMKKNRCHVKVGASTITGTGQIIGTKELKKHEFYGRLGPFDNDIALLILKRNVKFEFGSQDIKKIILVEPDVVLRNGIDLQVSGYASMNVMNKNAGKLLLSEMMVISRHECELHFPLLTPSMFCARYPAERLLYDNGGPAVYRDILVGILSFGGTKSSSAPPRVAVFTNVSYFHRWIFINTKRLLSKYCVMPSEECSYVEVLNTGEQREYA